MELSRNEVHSRIGNIQPSVVQVDEQNLMGLLAVAAGVTVP